MKKVHGITMLECVLYIGLSVAAFFMVSTFVLTLTTSLKKMMTAVQIRSLQYSALEALHASLRQASPDINTWHMLSRRAMTWQKGESIISWYQKGTRFMCSYKKGTAAMQYRVLAEDIKNIIFDWQCSDTHVLFVSCTLISSTCVCKRKYVYKIGVL